MKWFVGSHPFRRQTPPQRFAPKLTHGSPLSPDIFFTCFCFGRQVIGLLHAARTNVSYSGVFVRRFLSFVFYIITHVGSRDTGWGDDITGTHLIQYDLSSSINGCHYQGQLRCVGCRFPALSANVPRSDGVAWRSCALSVFFVG